MRSIARVVGCSRKTVAKLMIEAGAVAARFHDVYIRNIAATRIECDELWAFCYAKEAHVEDAVSPPRGAGDLWTWTAIDPDSKLLVSWLVGDRDMTAAFEFMDDLASRLANRVQLTTDGFQNYIPAVERAFGDNVDYAQLIKVFNWKQDPDLQRQVITGNPDESFISTSIVERMNLTIRMSQRRYTRKTNAFSKRIQHHRASFALLAWHYNFCRPHKSLSNPYLRTPAMAAGLTNRIHTIDSLIDMVNKATPPPRRPKRYKKPRTST